MPSSVHKLFSSLQKWSLNAFVDTFLAFWNACKHAVVNLHSMLTTYLYPPFL